MAYRDVDRLNPTLRAKLIRPGTREILISRLTGSEQEHDASELNCGGYGRIRTLATDTKGAWGDACVRHRVAYHNLRVSPDDATFCQVFQNAGCNFRCWFCYVDYALLVGNVDRARWFRPEQLVEMYLAENRRANILVLSGGQPDLTPEWAVWTIEDLDRRGLGDRVFVWMDDNLSGFTSWEVLRPAQWDILRRPTFARLCSIKGIDEDRFTENTCADPRYFARQFEILRRLIQERIEIYIELSLTSQDASDVTTRMRGFVDRLVGIHPYLPLRVNPTEIREYTPTAGRLNAERRLALANQYTFNEAWKRELADRYSADLLALHQAEVRLW